MDYGCTTFNNGDSLFVDYFEKSSSISKLEEGFYAVTGSTAAATSAIVSALLPTRIGSCIGGSANIISTGTGLAWFIRGKDRNLWSYTEAATTFGGLGIMSIIDMVNCASPSTLKGSADFIGFASAAVLLLTSFIIDAITLGWIDILESAMQLLNALVKMVLTFL